ncbi:TetR/AcrR family transcriptional regulator [Gordonia hydrophobica]|uniref:Helix-turn-helix domain-containing protein n=1 Tax=Gordonia hydrophobica TaxID=40516 RepID=A0ABZ2U2T3_9ACTN|nr:TetR/AcrR family transcriptional regulator [Gordonia hydrophobica]MBM7367726.1 AcrR family transcriptional regulator [Gordonia hydrophobica]
MSTAQDRARATRKSAGALRRTQLLTAAAECFDEFGYAAVTVEMIADRAQTSRPTFYAYFKSKDEVFLALVESVSRELDVTQSLTGLEDATPREILAATTRAYLDALFSLGGIVSLIDVTASVDAGVAAIWTTAADRRIRAYARYLNDLPAGTIDPAFEPERLVRVLGDALHHGAKRWANGSDAERERFIVDLIAATERLLGL